MTKRNASNKSDGVSKEPLAALLSGPTIPTTPMGTPLPFEDLTSIDKIIDGLVKSKNASTARYFGFDAKGNANGSAREAVCFNGINAFATSFKGIGIAFQGYGGFEKGERWRKADEADLYTNIPIPFVMKDEGHYNEVSLQWLEMLLDPEGPFKSLLPVMYENSPEKVQARRAFIFPDVSLIPARLTWCFAIASRLGYANPRVVWRYLHLLGKGLDKRTASLIAGGFEHEVKSGEVTGRIIKSYTCGYLGVDVTAYAGRYLSADPIVDQPGAGRHGTYGSSKVFESGKLDLKKMTFENWDEVIAYVQARGLEQSEKLKQAA